jgi:HrpA-like RNA helicase
MASLPVSPSLARILIGVVGSALEDDLIAVVAMLSVEDIFIWTAS